MSLLSLARLAGLGRQTARTCVAKGWLNGPPFDATEAVVLRVAAHLLESESGSSDESQSRARNRSALALVRAHLVTGAIAPNARLIVAASTAEMALTNQEMASAVQRLGTQPLLILPVGEWAGALPT